MRTNFRYLPLLIIFIVGIWACKEPITPQPVHFRIAKTKRIYDYSDLVPSRTDSSTYLYRYDSYGRLINVMESFRSVSLSTYESTLYYNDQSQLTEVQTFPRENTFPYYPSASLGTKTKYTYDEKGNITAINVYDIQSTGYNFLQEEYKLFYNKDKKPSSLSEKYNVGSQFDPYTYETCKFTYEGDNITSAIITAMPVRANGYKSSIYTRKLQYDNKINPFYLLNGTPLRTYDYTINLCKNNLMKSDEVYSYDSNDLLVKSTETNGKTVTYYFYEKY